jgi:hypothetical protein
MNLVEARQLGSNFTPPNARFFAGHLVPRSSFSRFVFDEGNDAVPASSFRPRSNPVFRIQQSRSTFPDWDLHEVKCLP